MKKRLLLFVLLIWAHLSFSQTSSVSFTINTQPCNNNGVITATFTGLTAPITATYYIGNQPAIVHTILSGNTDVLTNYSGANLYVTAQDVNNTTAYGQFSAAPFYVSVSSTTAICPNPSIATATISGGASPYTYNWYNLATNNTVSTSNPASLAGGGYGLIVTDNNGCTVNDDSIGIYTQAPFNLTVSTTPANCTNGSASVTNISAGGTPPYSYLWSNNATTSSITGLTMGSYNVTVTDANGCFKTNYAYIQQSVSINPNLVTTPATCIQTNGAIAAFPSGGMTPYSYLWSNSATTSSISNIASGSYHVAITDANGCIGSGSAYVNSTTPVNATYTTTPSSCSAPTGSATLNITGGVAPYTVSWNTYPVQTGITASNLPAGNYSFHIVDANSCVRNGTVTIPPVNVISATFSSINPTCTAANGSITVSPSGGTAPYTYVWSNNATTSSINGLTAGYYSVTITDNAGCTANKYHSIYSSSPVSVGVTTTQASCIYNNDGSITATAYGGTAPYTYSWSNGANTATANNLHMGNYYLSVTDANGCTAHTYVFVPYNSSNNSCYCTITGTVYEDLNNNCVKDAGEPGIQNIQVHLSGFGYAYTNANGVYSFNAPNGSYTLSESVQYYYPLAACQNNSIAVNVTAGSGCSQTFNFANVVNPIHDVKISNWNFNYPVPGNNYNISSIITNSGTIAEPTMIAGMNTDIQLSAPTITPSSIYTNTGVGSYSLLSGALNLAPGSSQYFNINYAVPTNIPLGTSLVFKDTVAYTGPMTNWTNDYTPWNNVRYFSPTVVGSYDPNFKEVLPKGVGPTGKITYADSVLEYMVHFQNTGTYQAQNIVVIDTLDADLDWSTLHPEYQSHPCKVTIGENGVVKFTFTNINLPAKIYDEQGSNGMFTYTIKTKSGLPLGTKFTNSAAIYFDYNDPVITNTTINTLYDPLGIINVSGNNESTFVLYPNPASKICNVKLNTVATQNSLVKVVDISGKLLATQTIEKGTQTVAINVANLAAGVYFVTVSGEKTSTQKMVIMK